MNPRLRAYRAHSVHLRVSQNALRRVERGCIGDSISAVFLTKPTMMDDLDDFDAPLADPNYQASTPMACLNACALSPPMRGIQSRNSNPVLSASNLSFQTCSCLMRIATHRVWRALLLITGAFVDWLSPTSLSQVKMLFEENKHLKATIKTKDQEIYYYKDLAETATELQQLDAQAAKIIELSKKVQQPNCPNSNIS